MANYFEPYSEELLLKVNIDSKEEFPDWILGRGTEFVDGKPYPTDINGKILTEQEIKEERLNLKRQYYQRLLELDLIDNTPVIREKMGLGHYRENKGYNKYGEYCCNKCKQFKPRNVEYYPKDGERVDGLGYTCRECLKSYSKEYYRRKKEREKEKLKQKSQIRFE